MTHRELGHLHPAREYSITAASLSCAFNTQEREGTLLDEAFRKAQDVPEQDCLWQGLMGVLIQKKGKIIIIIKKVGNGDGPGLRCGWQ